MSNQSQQVESVDQLQESLQAKNVLIEQLTTRLEETFSELDRIHRSGGKGGKAGGGMPGELVEQQAHLADQLGEAVEYWNAAQPVEQLGRIENGIQQILSSLSSGNIKPTASPVIKQMPVAKPQEPPAPAPKPVGDSEDFWAATKARLMGEEPPKPTVTTPKPEAVIAKPQVEEAAKTTLVVPDTAPASEVITFDTSDYPPAPEPVDDDADNLTLHESIEARNDYIAYLTGRLRTEQQRRVGVIDWDSLVKRPDDLASQLREIEKMLNAQLKESEISLSLERASIARQRGKLFQVKRHLEQEVARIGKTSPSESRDENDEKASIRWAKMFSREK